VLVEIALNAGSVVLEGAGGVVSPSRQEAAAPRVRARMLAHFMVRLYIAVVCSYGEALADRIVSYRDILSDIVSYLSFSLMAVSCHHYYYCYPLFDNATVLAARVGKYRDIFKIFSKI